jgi:cyanophycinase
MGYILLEGGGEFGGRMADPDRQAMTLAGGPAATISIIPAAAAPDNNHVRAGQNGVNWFQGLGAAHVSALPLIDKASANNPAVVQILENSNLVYLLGGFPHYLAQVLADSRAWQAILTAYAAGAVIAGSSAGAMVLCEQYYDPGNTRVLKGLNLMKGICVLPHHDTFGHPWAAQLEKQLPDITLMGIDEESGALYDASTNKWQVSGKGGITLYQGGSSETFTARDLFIL